ncbi:MAG: tetratricopeptide repeat protein, partial [Anaerolineae bacterium]
MNTSAIETDVLVEDVVGEPADAVALRLRQATEAVERARRRREPTALTRALVVLARVYLRLGHYAEAQALADEILAQAPPRSPDRADAWQVLANCAVELESPAQAEAYYRTAAELARELGYHRAQVAALHGLAAGVYFLRGRFDLALAADAE